VQECETPSLTTSVSHACENWCGHQYNQFLEYVYSGLYMGWTRAILNCSMSVKEKGQWVAWETKRDREYSCVPTERQTSSISEATLRLGEVTSGGVYSWDHRLSQVSWSWITSFSTISSQQYFNMHFRTKRASNRLRDIRGCQV